MWGARCAWERGEIGRRGVFTGGENTLRRLIARVVCGVAALRLMYREASARGVVSGERASSELAGGAGRNKKRSRRAFGSWEGEGKRRGA